MKPLETQFKREGWDYRQIWREKDVAVYEYGPAPRYELIIIQMRPDREVFGNFAEAREAYPKTSQWGTYGWTLGPKDREFAIQIAKAILNLESNKRIAKIHAMMDQWPRYT